MKNTKLSVSLIACLLSVGGLAGCSKVKSSSDGVLLKYTIGENKYEITADDILEKSFDDSSKYQAIFDIIYSVLVKNYFNNSYSVDYYGNKTDLGSVQMGSKDDKPKSEGTIYARANQKVEEDKETARTNADANNTRYKKELETILSSHGVSTLAELKDKYVEEIQKEVFEKNFYTYYIEDLKMGAGATHNWGETPSGEDPLSGFWPGYIKDQAPYHVSHILVKLEDGSGTNYADGTISGANAKKLYNVVNALASSSDSFSTIAKQFSEDTGSRVLSGDLGIMDASTSYVNEFKLGVYAYENYYNSKVSEGSPIKLSEELVGKYTNAVKESYGDEELVNGVPVIPAKVFEQLKDVAEEDENDDDSKVLDNNAAFYPRNIIYNKYLNRHSVAFIVGDEEAAAGATHGYHKFTEGKLADVGPILSVKVAGEWQPVLCVRAGSDYQGIHFIVINRSPFRAVGLDGNSVSLSNYYTTFYPDQKEYYPKNASNEQLNTYINFSSNNSDISATKKRAEELASKLKSFDSDKLSKYIFKKFKAAEGVKINQSKLETSLDNWINTSVEKAVEEREEKWSKTWNEYIDTLARQGSERSKLIPQACRIGFSKADTKAETETLWVQIPDHDKAEKKYTSEIFKQIKSDLVYLGYSVTIEEDTHLIASDEDVEAFLKGITIQNAYKTKGGLCNDGQEHIK